jgi:hypothetical protein
MESREQDTDSQTSPGTSELRFMDGIRHRDANDQGNPKY